ncbi:2-aminoethylphosphonate--pyruvate transaminase [Lacticaseibacillus sp. N501-2]|uniref:2-aminoethylphosphonate--pyruvate transaminase n=1 Tax=Lacticaseibacillus salsurae TaxID=3367729 RepID=UPI0038B25C89
MPLIEALDQQAAKVPLLLTPGPLTTSATVKATMLVDHGTWDDDYKVLTQSIRHALLAVGHADPELYTSVLMQGSGSFGVEATLQTAVPKTGTLLIAMNGAYGQRMATMATRLGIKHLDLDFGETQIVSAEKVLNVLHQHPEVTHFAMVHSETTTGILNPLTPLIPKLADLGIVTIVDAMSSFGGVPIDVTQLGVDYVISSANKCIQGVPGFAFVLAKQATLAQTKGNARSLSLDLYDQWRCFEAEAGKWRFTSPTHTVYAFRQALNELIEEGGVAARHARYAANEKQLRAGMLALGFEPLLPTAIQSPIITSFKYPSERFDFRQFYEALKQAGFIIYPGKVSKAKTFRIGNIGEVYSEDIRHLLHVIAKTSVAKALVATQ